MWRNVVLSSWIAAGSQAYGPIQWTKFPAENFVLAPMSPPSQALFPPQKLSIRDQHGRMSYEMASFTANTDKTITWDAMGWCIEASDHEDTVRLNQCTGGPEQRWNSVSTGHGRDMIQLQGSNKCLNVVGEGSLDGAQIGLRECQGKASESWFFEKPAPPLTRRSSQRPVLAAEQKQGSSFIRHVMISCAALASLGLLGVSARLYGRRIRLGTTAPTRRSSMHLKRNCNMSFQHSLDAQHTARAQAMMKAKMPSAKKRGFREKSRGIKPRVFKIEGENGDTLRKSDSTELDTSETGVVGLSRFLRRARENFVDCQLTGDPIPRELVAAVRTLMDTVQAEELGVSVTDFPSKSDIGYQPVYAGPDMDICIFLLKAGSCLPLHNHPGMNVFGRLLFGQMRVISYDPEPTSATPVSKEKERKVSKGFGVQKKPTKQEALRRLPAGLPAGSCWASLRSDEVIGPDPISYALGPDNGNVHELHAIEDCAFFDILVPPYNDRAGRSCTYYTREDDDGAGRCVLVPTFPNLPMERSKYRGPSFFE